MLVPERTILPRLSMDGESPLGSGQPCVSVYCVNCGIVQFLNAFVLDLAGHVDFTASKGGESHGWRSV